MFADEGESGTSEGRHDQKATVAVAADAGVKGKQRERWTVEPKHADDVRTVGRGGVETAAAAAAGYAAARETRTMKEKPFKLDAWAFSYAS